MGFFTKRGAKLLPVPFFLSLVFPMGVSGDETDRGEFGVGDRISLEPVSGHAKQAKDIGRGPFGIHGGREQYITERVVNVIVGWTQDEQTGEWTPIWEKRKEKIPGYTSGCVRLEPDKMRQLVEEIKKPEKTECKNRRVVVITGPQPERPQPEKSEDKQK